MEVTTFSEVFERAMFQFRDRSLIHLNIEDRERVLMNHMFAGMNDFQRVCRVDLPYNTATMSFEVY